ncbi:hypothetical protein CSB96_3060 [Pseudomonas aeruginosa]|nr:hypothetical protein CSB96_3060 [Pseudomonas aeruginosa]
MTKSTQKYSSEMKEQVIRLVLEYQHEPCWITIKSIYPRIS